MIENKKCKYVQSCKSFGVVALLKQRIFSLVCEFAGQANVRTNDLEIVYKLSWSHPSRTSICTGCNNPRGIENTGCPIHHRYYYFRSFHLFFKYLMGRNNLLSIWFSNVLELYVSMPLELIQKEKEAELCIVMQY